MSCSSEPGKPRPPVPAIIVGYGYWGRILAQTIQASKRLRLVGIVDSSPSALQSARHELPHIATGAHVGAVTAAIAAKLGFVATPPTSHASMARELLLHGLHTSVEKPFGTTAGEIRPLLHLAQSAGLNLSVNYTYLFSHGVQTARRLLRQKAIGDLRELRFRRINATGRIAADINVVHDLLCHDLAITASVTGALPAAVRVERADFTGLRMTRVAVATEYRDGFRSLHDLDWGGDDRVRTLLAIGTNGHFLLEQNSGAVTVTRATTTCAIRQASGREPLQRYVDVQARRAADPRPHHESVTLALQIMDVVSAALYSAVSGGCWVHC